MKKIGFIGIGVMGASMSRRLLQAGLDVHLLTRTKEKAKPLLDEGAIWENSLADMAKTVDVVVTMLGYPADVETVYFSENGLLAHLKANQLAIDMTTSAPTLAVKLAQKAAEKKVWMLDAPVSGGDIGAKNGTLSIMVGGDKQAFDKALPVFNILGENIQHQGAAGAGQHTKMVNQIAIASNMVGMIEALIYAEQSGLDLKRVLKSIQTGAASSWSLSHLAPRIIAADFSPGFFVKHFVKDMRIALEEAKKMAFHLPGLQLAERLYDQLAKNGLSEQGTQALMAIYRQNEQS